MSRTERRLPPRPTAAHPTRITTHDSRLTIHCLAWLRWPDRATADAAWEKMQQDPAMKDMDMPFDGKRMMWGGFETVFEQAASGRGGGAS